MHHARQHAQTHQLTRTRERRHRLAHEAARLMAESGIRDYHQAKLKAAERLGIHDDASLPRNREIEEALREYQRLFTGEAHAAALRARREAALRALEFFAGFDARLVGPVLDGTADTHAPVWVFAAEELSFDLTVLPVQSLRQAPLSGVDERPMKRASAAQLRELLAEDEISDYFAG